MFDYTDEEDSDDSDLGMPGVESAGQEFPVRHNDLVQANAGMGHTPQYNPAAYPLAPLGIGRGLRGSPDGIGEYALLNHLPTPSATRNGVLGSMMNGSPLVRGLRAVSGLGADAVPAPGTPGAAAAPVAVSAFLVAAVAVGLVATGVGSYYVGKAIAPSRSDEKKYAWWGVFAGLVGGPIGLGIEAFVGLGHKGH